MLIPLGFLASASGGSFPFFFIRYTNPTSGRFANILSIDGDAAGNIAVGGSDYVVSSSSDKFYMSSYSPDGTLIWQQALQSFFADRESAIGIGIGQSGSYYATGYIVNGWSWLVKRNSSGATTYVKRIIGPNDSNYTPNGLKILSNENVLLFGRWFDSGSSIYRAFISKLNSDATNLFTKTLYGAGSSEQFWGASTDSAENIYAFYQYSNGLNIGIVKYDSNGALQWQRAINGNSNASTYENGAVDPAGNVYVTGHIGGTTGAAVLIAKLDTSGAMQWQRVFQGGLYASGAVDSTGNLYTIFMYAGDFYIVKYDTNGNLVWQRKIIDGSATYFPQIKVDANKDIIVTFRRNAAFGESSWVARLPADGSLTGTYSVGGLNITYTTSALSFTTGTYTMSTTSAAASTMTPVITNDTQNSASTTSITSTTKVIP